MCSHCKNWMVVLTQWYPMFVHVCLECLCTCSTHMHKHWVSLKTNTRAQTLSITEDSNQGMTTTRTKQPFSFCSARCELVQCISHLLIHIFLLLLLLLLPHTPSSSSFSSCSSTSYSPSSSSMSPGGEVRASMPIILIWPVCVCGHPYLHKEDLSRERDAASVYYGYLNTWHCCVCVCMCVYVCVCVCMCLCVCVCVCVLVNTHVVYHVTQLCDMYNLSCDISTVSCDLPFIYTSHMHCRVTCIYTLY